ncbi:MAG: class I SAM-dependent methyltransferase [Candidatus Nanopelagicales bacterium]|nr:class I SAM-dependent methyltransferase [Candidatus Nanopelagicales bacterium]
MTDTRSDAASALLSRWSDDLASWAIPDEILAQAEEKPWIHPVAMFTVEEEIADSHSHRIAREALPEGGSVLDIGSGGGRASMALAPPAGSLVAVDHQQGMLDAFAEAADKRGVRHREFLGDWPAVSDAVPECDVVVCHHVAYNVADIGPFLVALDLRARSRVVLELPMRHPMSNMNSLWKRFWNLDRPTQPTAEDLGAIARALGFDAHVDIWEDETWGRRVEMPQDERVRFARIRLCLTEDRDAEVAAALIEGSDQQPRQVATVWWDVQR